MKTRDGFVSNSSSSSFTIHMGDLNALQLRMIENYKEEAEAADLDCGHPGGWSIEKKGFLVTGYTTMDNFNMFKYLTEYLRVDPESISWDYS